ncbi:Protein kinase domain-containing protein [Cladophialophora immunda]|nr:Protein kinase domain-containing protein [Cladophialophora immunda]
MTSTTNALQDCYNSLIAKIEDFLDDVALEAPAAASTRASTWLENLLAGLDSWGVDIRASDGSLALIENSPVGFEVRSILLEIDHDLSSPSSIITAFTPLKPPSETPDIKPDSGDKTKIHSISSALGNLRDLANPIRLVLVTTHSTGPYEVLKSRIDDISAKYQNSASQPLDGGGNVTRDQLENEMAKIEIPLRPSTEYLEGAKDSIPSPRPTIKPGQALCTLIITSYQKPLAQIEDLIVEYAEETAFEKLSATATEWLTAHTRGPDEVFYLKAGQIKLVRDDTNTVAFRGILESEREWEEHFPRRIYQFLGSNGNVRFHLEIEWEYSSLQVKPVHGLPYKDIIRSAIRDKMRKNWQGNKYVPQKDLDRIMTQETISKLIREDGTLNDAEFFQLTGEKRLEEETFTDLIKLIRLQGAGLFAFCVYADLPLVFFYWMWKQGLRDTNLPLSESDLPDKQYRTNSTIAFPDSGGFAPHMFARNEMEGLRHFHLRHDAVVPILLDEDRFDHILGEGSLWKVYKVHIDGDHHSFSPFRGQPFVLKAFREPRATAQMDVDNVSSTLNRHAEVSHPNITTHLASWDQDRCYYMLFRCADCSLRKYMKGPPPVLTKSNLLSLLCQMRGLADGLRYIHNLAPSNLVPDLVDEKGKNKPGRRRQACFHHDLKPANILVTVNPDDGDLLFSISDFGTRRIGQILQDSARRRLSKNPLSDSVVPAYGAPDALLEGRASRPYDLWSMGCIFLELLTWIVGLEEEGVENFAKRRREDSPPFRGDFRLSFWDQDQSRNVYLKPSVERQLRLLKDHCEGWGVFPELVRVVCRLLNVQPSRRPDASQLVNALDAILIQARRDLRNETFYLGGPSARSQIVIASFYNTGSDDGSRRPALTLARIEHNMGRHFPTSGKGPTLRGWGSGWLASSLRTS